MTDETTGRAEGSSDIAKSDAAKLVQKQTGAPLVGAPVSASEHTLANELGITLPKTPAPTPASPVPPTPPPVSPAPVASPVADKTQEASPPKAPPEAEAVPEPVILEEKIIKRTTPLPPKPIAPEIPKEISKADVEPSIAPVIPNVPPRAIPPAPKPVPVPTVVAPPKPVEPEKIPAPAPAVAPAPAHASAPAAPATPAAPITPADAGDAAMNNDISNILKSIKLPERRTMPGATPKAIDTTLVETTLGSTPSTPLPPADVKPAEPALPAGEKPIVAMHTLKQDLQEVVRDQKISLVHAVALEEEKRSRAHETVERIAPQTSTRRTRGLIFGILLSLMLGAAALFGVYIVMQSSAPTPVQQSDSLVFAEQAIPLPLDNISPLSLKGALAQARGSASGNLGSITRIVPIFSTFDEVAQQEVERLATLEEYLRALGVTPPPELMRALGSEYFFGIHTVDENAPLFVIPVTSYDRAFASMLVWEKKMNTDLSPVFTAVPTLMIGPDGIPTERAFTDEIMRNYDVRALKDDAGTIQLYYSFPTRDLLVIAESPYSFTEILSRLQAERRL